MENIIFDLGNVIIDIDFSLTFQALAKLSSGYSPEEIAEIMTDQKIWENYEKGVFTDKEFRTILKSNLLLNKVTDAEIDEAFCALLLPIDPNRIALLKKLAKNHRLFILSNTNQIHFKKVEKMIKEATGTDIIEEEIIECAFLSYEMGMAKPDKAIYKQLMDEAMILPKETLFLDDMLPNVKAAEKLGIKTVQINPKEFTILDYFKKSS
jgi:glucose-1-phosphatase